MKANAPDIQNPDKSGQRPVTRRGFAAMDPQLQKHIASQGGKAAHASGKAHQFDSAQAREAGRKGGLAGRRSTGAPTE